MAKLTKTNVKNLVKGIEAKAKRIYMADGKYSDVMTTKDMVDILKVIDRVKNRMKSF